MTVVRAGMAVTNGGASGWTRPADVKAHLARQWERGELLRPLTTDEAWPARRVPLKGPASHELAERFEAVRVWIAELTAMPQVRIEWRAVNHRVLGAQRLPRALWVDTLEAAAALLGKRGDVARFGDIVAATRARQPALLAWLRARPLRAVALAGAWPQLLDVVVWLAAHPRPGLYLRQVDLPGIHSKFIEAHRGVLAELFDLALAGQPDAIGPAGASQFARRYGFLDKPVRIRLRVLDARIDLLPGATLPDVTLDADSFATLAAPIRRVFITENETNFLAFPPAAHAIVIFGAGYGWDALARADWLARCTIHYWGDIDTHGFAILDRLRSRHAHVASFLMDRETLMAHKHAWGDEASQFAGDLPRLDAVERALFDELRDNRIRQGLRLEQERVGFSWVRQALRGLG